VHRLIAIVTGSVQGVGFRAFVLRRARTRGLTGTVRNQPDGTVEVEAEGAEAELRALLAELEQGPRGARVTRVDSDLSAGPARHRTFEITF
jgi:acylphosphatase